MKKILAVLISCMTVFTLSGCGNKSLSMGNYSFTKVHIFSTQGDVCCKVETWYDTEIGIKVQTDNGDLFLSEGTYMLVENYCPICNK